MTSHAYAPLNWGKQERNENKLQIFRLIDKSSWARVKGIRQLQLKHFMI